MGSSRRYEIAFYSQLIGLNQNTYIYIYIYIFGNIGVWT
jgi:hypothetical protein